MGNIFQRVIYWPQGDSFPPISSLWVGGTLQSGSAVSATRLHKNGPQNSRNAAESANISRPLKARYDAVLMRYINSICLSALKVSKVSVTK